MDLSFIIPAYNTERYIENCIDSILNQKESNLEYELLIIDDGSQDNTVYVVEEKLSKLKINYNIIKQSNQGVSSARNKGIDYAKGNYLIFLDSDDYLSVNFFSMINQDIKEKSIDLMFWDFVVKDDSGNNIGENISCLSTEFLEYRNGIDVLKELIVNRSLWICTGCFAVNRNFMKKNDLKYDLSFGNGEDQLFLFSLLLKADAVKGYRAKQLNYIVRENSISTTFNLKKFDSVIALKKILNCVRQNHNDVILVQALQNYITENYLYNLKTMIKQIGVKKSLNSLQIINSSNLETKNDVFRQYKRIENTAFTQYTEMKIAQKNIILYCLLYSSGQKIKNMIRRIKN